MSEKSGTFALARFIVWVTNMAAAWNIY